MWLAGGFLSISLHLKTLRMIEWRISGEKEPELLMGLLSEHFPLLSGTQALQQPHSTDVLEHRQACREGRQGANPQAWDSKTVHNSRNYPVQNKCRKGRPIWHFALGPMPALSCLEHKVRDCFYSSFLGIPVFQLCTLPQILFSTQSLWFPSNPSFTFHLSFWHCILNIATLPRHWRVPSF